MRRSLATMDQASADRIRRYQERRLRLLVRLVAARSPFYRRWFAEAGVDPASIRTLEDLPRLPLLDRQAVMDAPADFAVQPLRLMWPSSSSGTSGRPVTVYRTAGSSAFEQAALQRQWGWFGLPRDARRVVLRGSSIAVDRGVLTHEIPGDHQLLVSSFHLTPDALPEILRTIRAYRPDAVEGWTSSLTLLAARIRDAGERLPVQAVITSSETISTRQRELMGSVFEAPIVDHYGQTERVAMAGTCEALGYHVFPTTGSWSCCRQRTVTRRSSVPPCTTGASRCCATAPVIWSIRLRPAPARAGGRSPASGRSPAAARTRSSRRTGG